ncbi:MAG: CPBP family intramembrane metalloprotease [Alphaproteobacteria bacterium]|nr:CPBP family intramembrane metalloprotease [Alphaproteobacteria bacterium]
MPFRAANPDSPEPVPPPPKPLSADLPFVELAQVGDNAWWRYLLSVFVIIVVAAVLQIIVGIIAFYLGLPLGQMMGEEGGSPEEPNLLAFIFIMLSVAAMLPATLVAVRAFHHRPVHTLFTARARFDWGRCLTGAGVVLVTVAVATVTISAVWPGVIEYTLDASAFLLFLPFVLALVPVQVLAEEVLFRGYVLQGVARLTRLWAVRLIVPAALFTVAHFANQEFRSGGWWAAADYAVISLYLGYLALRGNGLEDATGFHLGLNASFFLIVGYGVSDLRTPSLFFIPGYDFRLGLLASLAICAIHYALVIRRRRGASDGA